jgi:hypothetical protein
MVMHSVGDVSWSIWNFRGRCILYFNTIHMNFSIGISEIMFFNTFDLNQDHKFQNCE